eukprot:300846-Prorocentrum_minimum.AAC.1
MAPHLDGHGGVTDGDRLFGGWEPIGAAQAGEVLHQHEALPLALFLRIEHHGGVRVAVRLQLLQLQHALLLLGLCGCASMLGALGHPWVRKVLRILLSEEEAVRQLWLGEHCTDVHLALPIGAPPPRACVGLYDRVLRAVPRYVTLVSVTRRP